MHGTYPFWTGILFNHIHIFTAVYFGSTIDHLVIYRLRLLI
jgi:hypothetical protein